MSAKVIWRPEPLTARLVAAASPAASEFGRLAAAKAPAKRIAATMRVAGGPTNFTVGSSDPVATFFEFGTQPHAIAPKGTALRLADGRFVSGAVNHPGMRSQPFLRPLLPLWASLYNRNASGAFRGF